MVLIRIIKSLKKVSLYTREKGLQRSSTRIILDDLQKKLVHVQI